jgi:hypothetical protein
MAPYDPTGETFADLNSWVRDEYASQHPGVLVDALDRPLPRNDWLRTCAQAKEARMAMEVIRG